MINQINGLDQSSVGACHSGTCRAQTVGEIPDTERWLADTAVRDSFHNYWIRVVPGNPNRPSVSLIICVAGI